MSHDGRSQGTRRAPGEVASRHGFAVPRGQIGAPAAHGARFGRMFGDLAHGDPGETATGELLALIERASREIDADNEDIPAGHTYLGQFVDHDITFDPTSKLERDNDPSALTNFRTPRFDLDSLYGSGPDDQPYLYEWLDRRDRGVKLLLGRADPGGAHAAEDLPRNAQGRALIGDARNDENLIVAQLHLLFVRFHNRVVDAVRAGDPRMAGAELFEEAQRIVRWHYQWIVVHDFLERVAGRELVHEVLRPGAGDQGPTITRTLFDWQGEPSIPVEFSGAAYRFGHSMVRDDYAIRRGMDPIPIFGDHADPARHLGGFRRLPALLEIDWRRFFADAGEGTLLIDGRPATRNMSLKINHRIAAPLFSLPPDGERALADLNLRRGRALGLPAGGDVAVAMGERPLSEDELLLGEIASPGAREALREATPLWYYVLCEAGSRAGGRHLGRVGGRIVTEVLVGLLQADPQSYLHRSPAWRPTLPALAAGDFTMADLVRFTTAPPAA